jgi:hypothetical protein
MATNRRAVGGHPASGEERPALWLEVRIFNPLALNYVPEGFSPCAAPPNTIPFDTEPVIHSSKVTHHLQQMGKIYFYIAVQKSPCY